MGKYHLAGASPQAQEYFFDLLPQKLYSRTPCPTVDDTQVWTHHKPAVVNDTYSGSEGKFAVFFC